MTGKFVGIPNNTIHAPFKATHLNEDINHRKLFVGGIPLSSTEDSLRSFYHQFGEILDIKVIRDLKSGRSRGFGFITYKDTSSVDRAQAARPHLIDGKSIDSKRVISGHIANNTYSSHGRKVFVGGLKDVHDEHSLREHFEQFGKLLSIRILLDKNTGRGRGFGYIEFEDYDSADKAALNKNHMIKYLTVDVKKSDYKPDPSRKLGDQLQQADQNGPKGGLAGTSYPPGTYAPPYGYPPYTAWGTPQAYPLQTAAYGTPPQNAPPPPAWNGWTYVPSSEAPAANKISYGEHAENQQYLQRSYYGGPQKGGKLQTYRSAPYRS